MASPGRGFCSPSVLSPTPGGGLVTLNRDKHLAKKCFEEVIERNPSDSYAHHHLGLLLEEEFNHFERATLCYQRAIECNPENFAAWNSLGLRKVHSSSQEALRCFETALRLNPNYSRAWKNKALLLIREKDSKGARRCFEEALRVDPQNASVYVSLGELLEQERNNVGAERCYQAAVRADPANPSGLTRLGVMRRKEKQYDVAKEFFEKALALDPGDGRTAYKIGSLAEENLMDFHMAKKYYKMAHRLCPGDSKIRRRLRILRQKHFVGEPVSDDEQVSNSSEAVGQSESLLEFHSSSTIELAEAGALTNEECPQGHKLVRLRFKPQTYSPRATWACDECMKSIGGPDLMLNGALYCGICKYDLCYACSQRPRVAHLLPDKPRRLGHGGSGDVFREFDVDMKKYVAVKYIRNSQSGDVEREVELMREFASNPYVVNVFRCERGSSGMERRVVMELLDGSVESLIRENGAMIETAIRPLICDALKGLAALHCHSPPIVHRDIKPDNLLLLNNHVKISDFGLSKAIQGTLQNTTLLRGTPQYLPPECFCGAPKWSTAADIWAVGCTFVAMASGKGPYATVMNSDQIRIETIAVKFMNDPNFRPDIPSHLSPGAQRIVGWCLQPNRKLRPTAEQLLSDPYFTSAEIDGCEKQEQYVLRRGISAAAATAGASCEMVGYVSALTTGDDTILCGTPSSGAEAALPWVGPTETVSVRHKSDETTPTPPPPGREKVDDGTTRLLVADDEAQKKLSSHIKTACYRNKKFIAVTTFFGVAFMLIIASSFH